MDESQSAEEDLLSFLQPLTMPDEFTFEPRTRNFEDSSDDDVDQEPIPGPVPPAPVAPMALAAPVAPMAPMDAADPADPVVAVVSEAAATKANGSASSQPTEANGHKEDETVVEQDDDAIEYETPKSTRKSPAKRSIRRAAAPKTRKGGGDESPRESATGLLKWFAKSSADRRVGGSDSESDLEANVGSQVKTGKKKSRETTVSSGSEAEPPPDSLNFEVVIQPLSPAAAKEYTIVAPGDEIYRVLEVIKTDIPGEAWLSVEFEDGRIDQVSRSYRPNLAQDEHKYVPLRPFPSPFNNPLAVTQVESYFTLPFHFHPLHCKLSFPQTPFTFDRERHLPRYLPGSHSQHLLQPSPNFGYQTQHKLEICGFYSPRLRTTLNCAAKNYHYP